MSTPFRHDDHKFEWTQEQFSDWAHNLCVRYPQYMVSFIGVGEPPPPRADGPTEDRQRTVALGCCTQCAIFVRRDFWARTMTTTSHDVLGQQQAIPEMMMMAVPDAVVRPAAAAPYKSIYSYVLPELRDGRTRDERILDDVRYQIGLFRSHLDQYYNYETGLMHIPLSTVLAGIWRECDFDVAEMK